VLVAAERRSLAGTVQRIGTVVTQHPYAKAEVDCWAASSEGHQEHTLALSKLRCDWFASAVWSRLPRASSYEPPAMTAHGARDLPKLDVNATRQQNRLVVLRLRWDEQGRHSK
jgi:hypothetical protein